MTKKILKSKAVLLKSVWKEVLHNTFYSFHLRTDQSWSSVDVAAGQKEKEEISLCLSVFLWYLFLFPYLAPLSFPLSFITVLFCLFLSFCHFLFLPSTDDAPLSPCILFLLLSVHHFIISLLFLAATRDLSHSLSLSVSLATEFLRCNSSRVIRTHTHTHTFILYVHTITRAQAQNACLTAHVSHRSHSYFHIAANTYTKHQRLCHWSDELSVCFFVCF